MSGPHRPPPPIVKRPKPAEDGSSGAKVQMKMLCKWLMQELLDQNDEDIEATFVATKITSESYTTPSLMLSTTSLGSCSINMV